MRMVQPKGPQRERVLEAAARVYYEKGFATATMQDIADRVGILKGSLYYYVESKDALLVEIVERAHDEAWPVLTATSDGSVAELIGRYARWAVGAPVAAALMLERHPGVAAAAHDRLARVRAAYRDLFADAIAGRGPGADPQLAADGVVGFLAATARSTALDARSARRVGAFTAGALAA
jgi:AcrR family transcriptional regulator